jgi:hypothetical protein
LHPQAESEDTKRLRPVEKYDIVIYGRAIPAHKSLFVLRLIMTVKDFIEKCNLKVLVEGELDREITTCYIGDLLSWVMGRAPGDSAWLTVMGNINSIAVATLADVSCIVLVENAALDAEAKAKAEMHEVTILSTELNSYDLAIALSKLI